MILKETHAYLSPIPGNFYLVNLKGGKDTYNFYKVFLKHSSAPNPYFADVSSAKSMSLNLGPLESRIWSGDYDPNGLFARYDHRMSR